ncbi:DsbA family protein [Terrilactibacillus laevilacticus]|uniref:Thioredoxin domain-containing protein n=1 Tax=Terrilactibacillus laevilacticus TaxID=1380157 RepID=A0ABW5PR21_9BACI|nr:thioredoxin domain-containing protein [Terrilactibacillus laevilacticus]
MSNKKKPKNHYEQEKVTRRKQRQIVVISTALVIILLVAIIGIVLKTQQSSQPNENQNNPSSQETPSINYKEQPIMGTANAPVKLVEFGDYRCPYCKEFEQRIVPKIKKDFIDNGKVSFTFINYTILGKGSQLAANAAEMIYHQYPDSFWNFHKALYAAQGDEKKEWVTKDLLTSIAKKTVPSLDEKNYKQTLDDLSYQNNVIQDYNLAKSMKVEVVPSLFIDGKLVNNPLDYDVVKEAINHSLKQGD